MKGEVLVSFFLLLSDLALGRGHSILAPPREGGLCAISLEEQEETGLEQGEGEQGVGLMLLAEGKGDCWEALATAALISPAPGFWPMWRRAGWLRKREEGRPPPWPAEAPSITLLAPSRLERGSWPPLAARADGGRDKTKGLKEYSTFIGFQNQSYVCFHPCLFVYLLVVMSAGLIKNSKIDFPKN